MVTDTATGYISICLGIPRERERKEFKEFEELQEFKEGLSAWLKAACVPQVRVDFRRIVPIRALWQTVYRIGVTTPGTP
jgi:hypothetical protein